MPNEVERVDSYQELLQEFEGRRYRLYKEAHEKRMQADLLTEICASLMNSIMIEKKYKVISEQEK